MQAIFVSGSDTNVGKTIVSAWLAQHWQADYWKPLQSGRDSAGKTDTQIIQTLTTCHTHAERYVLSQPLSPHQAAALDQVSIQLNDFALPATARLVIEGAGGLLVPLNEQACVIDLIAHFNLTHWVPTLLVVRSGLGTINHTSLSVEALRARHLPILGVVMVGALNPANRAAIQHYARVPVLAELPYCSDLNAQALTALPLPQPLQEILDTL